MQGSVLYNFFTHGKLERSEGASITEGIGQGRVTANLQGAPIDSAMLILDEEAVTMVRVNPQVNMLQHFRIFCSEYSFCQISTRHLYARM